MMNEKQSTLIDHLEALRRTLLGILLVTALLFPMAYWASPYIISALVRWSFPPEFRELHYFSPMEVFMVRLKLAFVVALGAGYPVNALLIWRFLLPALYRHEKRALRFWLVGSAVLFYGGVAFCIWSILPLLMRFAFGFSGENITPMFGVANFVSLSGWMMLAFGVMFQAPVVVMLAVKFGLVSAESLARKRPYVVVGILILAAILTPPDVISQLVLGIPTWLLFELGLFLARRIEKSA